MENEKYNLTAITDKNEIYIKHFLDSIQGEEQILKNSKVIDVGSGAGFPSIPLAIVRKDVSFVLIDSLKKRINFLEKVIKELDLKNVRAYHKRIEEVKEKEGFDYAIARAVAPLNILSEYCLPFVKLEGSFIAYKSEKTEEEVSLANKAIEILGGKLEKIREYSLNINNEEFKRTLVIIKKIKASPAKYPRGGNKPRLEPLNGEKK